MTKPLLKWIGGKTKLLKNLSLYIPRDYKNYIEPFVGGGSLVFSLRPEEGVINDANPELINFYTQVRDQPLELLRLIATMDLSEEGFYAIREYDRVDGWPNTKSETERAARFLYLNKTAFNGIWRSNSKGKMNTPYGKNSKVNFPTQEHVLTVSELLRKITILNVDFFETIEYTSKHTFIYLDPPYIPYSSTANFTSYVSKGFNIKDQERLVAYCNIINSRGAKFLLSNSDTQLTRELFKDFEITAVNVYHSVGASSASRKNKGEVLIRNYTSSCTDLIL